MGRIFSNASVYAPLATNFDGSGPELCQYLQNYIYIREPVFISTKIISTH